jgi:glycine cleavage system regulatory protein
MAVDRALSPRRSGRVRRTPTPTARAFDRARVMSRAVDPLAIARIARSLPFLASRASRAAPPANAAFPRPLDTLAATTTPSASYAARARKPAHGAVSRYVITSFGRDRKGIVNEVTAAVLAARGNVEESRMARLRGDFTITMLVSFVRDQSDVDAFKSDLARIEGLTTSVRASSEDEAAKTVSTHRRVLLRGNDFPGITHAFTRVLFDRDVNIESMTTDTAPAPFGTERLFLVDALVRLSAGAASIDALGASLRALERDMGLDVEILEHEPAKQLR